MAPLLLLGIARGGRAGATVAVLALGVMIAIGGVRPGRDAWNRLDPDRPVELVGTTAGCWEPGTGGRLQVDRWRQGRTIEVGGPVVRVQLPDAATPPPCGARVRVRGYLRGTTAYRNVPEVRTGGWSLFLESERLLVVEGEGPAWGVATGVVRARLFPPGPARSPGEGLARALLLGDPAALDPRLRAALRRVGLAHLVAVSGLHVGFVAAIVLALAAPMPPRMRTVVALSAVAAYALLVGPRPSLLRAGGMAAVILGGPLLGRRPPAGHALALAAGCLVLLDPPWVESLGLQLSVAATAGILGAVGGAQGSASSAKLRQALTVALAAQVATLPWSLAAFHRVHPLGPAVNLMAIPWAAGAVGLALALAGLRAVGLPDGPALVALDVAALPLALLARLPPSPWWSLALAAPWPAAVAPTVVAMAAARRRSWPLAGVSAALLGGAVVAGIPARPDPGEVEVVVFDVGQGDAVLLRDRDHAVLVDGGGWTTPGFGDRVVRPALGALGVWRLDALVVSHEDRDHCGGILDLAAEVPAGVVLTGPLAADSGCAHGLVASGVPVRHLATGDEVAFGAWRLRAIGPIRVAGGSNARSLVLLATGGGRRMLLTGDADASAERDLVRASGAEGLAVDLLKVAHHGSRSSSTPELLRATRPSVALISAGRGNRYGHPAAEVLARLERVGARVWRSDRDGRIRLRWRSGGALRVEVLGGW